VFLSDDGTYTTDYLQLAGKDGEGAYASFVKVNVDQASMDVFKAELEKTFSVKFGDYDPYQGHGFDAANLIIDALDKVATVDASGNLVIDREALIKAVRNTKDYGPDRTLTCVPRANAAQAAQSTWSRTASGVRRRTAADWRQQANNC
jgi:branched-chain amino acid transport system substrate-binding protein